MLVVVKEILHIAVLFLLIVSKVSALVSGRSSTLKGFEAKESLLMILPKVW